ncbi:MAG: RluA family pseudouridine synthase [Planctomycetes bacterium]|nr:RluA family pseudouridine synthase [Planctomycetota bacterium]
MASLDSGLLEMIINEKITKENEGTRIDIYLRYVTGISRKEIQRQFRCVTVNGCPVKESYMLKVGDQIFSKFNTVDPEIKPVNIDLAILYEDDHVIAIDKPSGLLSCPAGKNPGEPSVLSALVAKYGKLARSGNPLMEGVIHRLDKECSGVIIFAKSNRALEKIKQQFSSRIVLKEYVALVHGFLRKPSLTVSAPLKLLKTKWKVKVNEEGKESITRVKEIKRGRISSLVQCIPVTGRSHQIRAHLAHIGNPIIGEKKYHLKCRVCSSKRLMLHSTKLQFIHPVKDVRLTIESQLPAEFKLI